MSVRANIEQRIDRLNLAFGRQGVDPFGISRRELCRFFGLLEFFYRAYFRVSVSGIERVPSVGRVMLVGNHSGGYAIDAGMVIASVFLDLEPPRLAHGMAEKFLGRLPFASYLTQRIGQLTGLPEHARRLLEADRLLLVFPEGTRGTAKVFSERRELVDFGTGFIRLALSTGTPIVPFGVVGASNALPTIFNAYRLGQRLGLPYIPVTPYLVPIPLPARMHIAYGEPMRFDGQGTEGDDVIAGYVERVKEAIAGLMEQGESLRGAA